MFPWRAFVSIVLVAFTFAFLTSDLNSRRTAHSSNLKQRRHDTSEVRNEFGARLPFSRDQQQYDSGLHKRDVCNDTFPGRFSQTCEPSNTLCCIIPGASRPAHTDCFVDTDSTCDSSGSNQCAPGLCCPANTNCVDNFNYTSSNLVRCNVDRSLIPGFSSSSSSQSASRTRTATKSASSTGTAASVTVEPTSAVPTSISQNDSSGLGGGAIAGIVIGALAAIAIGIVVGWFLFRRKNKAAGTTQLVPYNPYPQHPQEMPASQMYETQNGYYPQQPPKERYGHVEMPGEGQVQELP
ncbi:uncharacterized protein BDR25DRAFT_309418 [Lindgomyces ingoldianus]|uniref:Uncharacterized protein n=1 Tax=Lindgomyces ingoldianus TaxID=673940 RepID=A0ACB6RD49_9PLEO|nr:uncharacterized protein BDR25DRAFT_309418 [Lindgomyces ingoldianus]KAF2477121.1 hypothetical protein BDR25DRAFT_309418 [Lindgomyces ingoldianus]